ncbi:MAG: DUF4347 domain-containing protein, partial [Okeania sp. SIO2F4]|uniref:DUF4347 domain-containing protein n=1 Tax=Okeania sp. SIO2F4 TaxID=2607790 RepID=UPI00142BBF53
MASKLLGMTKSILFIDPNVEDYQILVRGTNPNIKIVILDTYRDSIQQITETLVRNRGVKTVHIVSHGAPGCLYLGNSQLNINSINNDYAQELEAWSVTNILLYGCNVAAGDTGTEFLEKLQQLTGANIAATARRTGNVALGGDWELEVIRGELEVDIPFTQDTQQQWNYVLDPFEEKPALFQVISGVLFQLNPLTGGYEEIGGTGDLIYNAAGYNRNDNYIYGFEVSNSNQKLLRIDSTGTVEYVKNDGTVTTDVNDLDIFTVNISPNPTAGDIDRDNNLWITNRDSKTSIRRINLDNPVTATTINLTGTPPSGIMPTDLTYVDHQNSFYGISSEGELVTIDIRDINNATISTTTIQLDSGGNLGAANYGATWNDREGKLYVSANTGQLYHIRNFATTPVAEELLPTEATNSNDGISDPWITSVFDIPLIDLDGTDTPGTNYETTFTENGGAVNIVDIATGETTTDGVLTTNGLIIRDYINNGTTADGDRLHEATIILTNPLDGDDEKFLVNGVELTSSAIVTGTNLTATVTTNGDGEKVVTLTPTTGDIASVDDFATALKDIQYENTSENPDTTDRILQIALTDENRHKSSDIFGPNSNQVHITIIEVSDPPTIDLDWNDSSGATNNNYTTTFTDAAVAIGDSDVSITDVDDTNIESATIVLTNRPDGDTVESLSVNSTLPTGITASSYDQATGTITLTGSAPLADYQSAIAQIEYNNTSANPDTTARSVTVVVNDGDSDSNTATTTISINSTNNPPVADNESFTMNENDSSITLNLLDGDTDPDGDDNNLSIKSINGTDLTPPTAQTITVPNGTVNVTPDGTITFTPDADFNGDITFDYVVQDENDGEDTGTVTGTVNPVNNNQEENTTLNPGDIAFVQYNADDTDNFKFVALVDIPASEEIKFTDKGWLGDNSGFRTSEGIVTWTAPAGGISAGTVVEINDTPSASVGTVSGGSLNFAATGDQIIAYQGTNTPIAALNNEGAATWQADATSTSTSALPQGLTNGTNAVAINEIDNVIYTGTTTGDKATLLAAINNSANWTGSNSTNQTFTETFTIGSGGNSTPPKVEYQLEVAQGIGGSGSDQGLGIATDSNGNVWTTGFFEGSIDIDGDGNNDLTSNGSADSYVAKFDSNGNLLFAQNIGGSGDDKGWGIATDSNGNVWATGEFWGSIDIDGDGSNDLTSNGTVDSYVAKFDSNGNLLFSQNIGGTAGDYGYDIATDGDSNIWVTGYFKRSIDIDGDGNNDLTSNGVNDSYIAKFDSNGNFLFAQNIGGSSFDHGRGIATDSNGNVWATGDFEGTIDIDGDGDNDLTSNGSSDSYVAKFDSNGNFLFAQNIGSSSLDRGNDIATDRDGNVWATGFFSGSIDIDGDGNNDLTVNGYQDSYIAKFDSNGNLLFAQNIGDLGYGIATDSNGNVWATGTFAGSIDIDEDGNNDLTSNGSWDSYVANFDSNGNLLFAQNIGGSNVEHGNSIATDSNGNVWATGEFRSSIDIDSDGNNDLTNN